MSNMLRFQLDIINQFFQNTATDRYIYSRLVSFSVEDIKIGDLSSHKSIALKER
jgi:hypothetical protein